MIDVTTSTTVGDVVARDLRTAAVFARHGIDFCCGGRRSIGDACLAGGLDPGRVIDEIHAISARDEGPEDVSSWPPARVIGRIMERHHAYVRRQIPVIEAYLAKLAAKKGEAHPELVRLRDVFAGLARELLHHMEKEEMILFPYILAMSDAHEGCTRLPPTPFGTIRNPVRMMEAEHQQAGADLFLMRQISDGFRPPAEACVTWRACFSELEAFERDLHEHVHLENNVLFPAATRLEETLV
jgi:regulator of cell morphogenesis and NO signaling